MTGQDFEIVGHPSTGSGTTESTETTGIAGKKNPAGILRDV